MTRPTAGEWSVLGLDRDPVPGNPESLERIVSAYSRVASAVNEAHDVLVSADGITEEANGKLPGRLRAMAETCRAAVLAYAQYIPALRQAQTISLLALERARAATGELREADDAAAVSWMVLTAAKMGGDPTGHTRAQVDAAAASSRREQARQALDQAKAILRNALTMWHAAANGAAKNIHELPSHSLFPGDGIGLLASVSESVLSDTSDRLLGVRRWSKARPGWATWKGRRLFSASNGPCARRSGWCLVPNGRKSPRSGSRRPS